MRLEQNSMSAYGNIAIDQLIKIDVNHAEFVRALVMCHKPHRVLELGFGSGATTRSILAGLSYNRQNFEYTVVDNWLDFDGVQPAATRTPEFNEVSFMTNDERDFVKGCKSRYEFIFSDADHHNTQEWFDITYDRVLESNGVLIYHDVTNKAFPNLFRIYQDVVRNGYNHILLNRASLPSERCERGLLAIFKQ
jgi:predicted O-methyltransferase YrrM